MSSPQHNTLTHHETPSAGQDPAIFGFWLYILTDCILFSVLFATYIVLKDNTFGGPAFKEWISLPYVLVETLLLLFSSFSYGLGMMAFYKKRHCLTMTALLFTVLLGAGFIGMEIHEFITLCREGHSWTSSGALSAFFALVGTHGLHVSIGLLWMLVLIVQCGMQKFRGTTLLERRLVYLGLFWHFLDIVWIFVFTIVYLMGVL